MVPTTAAGVLVFVAALAPGLLWLRLAEGRRVRPRRSPALEIAEVVVVGSLLTVVALIVVVALGEWIGLFLDIGEFSGAENPHDYAVDHLGGLLVSASAVLVVAGGFAVALAQFPRDPALLNLRPGSTVALDVLGIERGGASAYLGVRLDDGRIIEGYLHSYSTDNERFTDLSLSPPVFIRATESHEREPASGLDYVLLPGDRIVDVGVVFEGEEDV